MSSVNKAIILGRLGRDPEVRTFQNGGRVCNLSVATEESWKDKQTGERKSRTEWHRVTIFNEHLVGVAEQYLSKGSMAYFEGQIETRKFTDSSGAERYTTEIVLRPFRGELVLLGDRQQQGPPAADDHLSEPPFDAHTGGTSRDFDDDLTF